MGYGAALAIVFSIVAGFFIIGSPANQRALRIDQQRVSDLQTIQWQVVNYYQQKSKLPVSSAELQDPISGFITPKDPETAVDYAYRITTPPYSFELCATFSKESRKNMRTASKIPMPVPASVHVGGIESSTWEHGIGQTCYERTIDPDLYPPIKPGVRN